MVSTAGCCDIHSAAVMGGGCGGVAVGGVFNER